MRQRLPGLHWASLIAIGFAAQGCVLIVPFIESDLPRDHKPDALSEAPACGSYVPRKYSRPVEEDRGNRPAAKDIGLKSRPATAVVAKRKKVTSQQKVIILVKQLKDGDDVRRTHAATDLGYLGSVAVSAVKPLAYALKNDESKWVRRAAAKSLGKLGTPVAVEALRAALSDRNRWVAHSAERALSRLRSRGLTVKPREVARPQEVEPEKVAFKPSEA